MIEALEILIDSDVTLSAFGKEDEIYLRVIELNPGARNYMIGPEEDHNISVTIKNDKGNNYEVKGVNGCSGNITIEVIEKDDDEKQYFWKKKKPKKRKNAQFRIFYTKENFDKYLDPVWKTNYPHATEHIIPMKNIETTK
jgi:hypothetical protein